MGDLTGLMFLLMIGLFLVCTVRRSQALTGLVAVIAMLSLSLSLQDDAVGDNLVYLVIPAFFVLLWSIVWMIYGDESKSRGRR